MIRRLYESNRSFRNSLIDDIDDIYSYDDGSSRVDRVIMQVKGWSSDDIMKMDDSDPDEGFYANFTTDELQRILNILRDEDDEERYTVTLKVTAYEESVLKDALENYSNVHFTKDSDMSRAAKNMLRQLASHL